MKYDKRSGLGNGQFVASRLCDCCNKPVGMEYVSDDEVVVDGSDGPGFYLCQRARCESKRDKLDVEGRRALFVAARAARA